MVEIAAQIPASLRAGDTWRWRRDDLSDYPASDWTLIYALRNADGYLDLTATPDADSYLIEATPTQTSAIAPGRYNWFASVLETSFAYDPITGDPVLDPVTGDPVTEVTARHSIDSGIVEILPDAHAAAAYDARSLPRKLLDAVDAALLSRATSDQLDLISTKFSDRALVRDRSSLIELRAKLLIEVRRIEGTGGRVSTINARFN